MLLKACNTQDDKGSLAPNVSSEEAGQESSGDDLGKADFVSEQRPRGVSCVTDGKFIEEMNFWPRGGRGGSACA